MNISVINSVVLFICPCLPWGWRANRIRRSRYTNTINILDVKTLHCNQYTSCGSRIANNIPKGDVLIILIRSKLIKNEFTKSNYLHVSV